MNIITLLHNSRDAVADDSATKTWSLLNYNREHQVYVGVDVRKPPEEANYPMAHLFPINKAMGYDLTAQNHGIGATCGVYNEKTVATGKNNVTEFAGVEHINSFRKLVETAIIGVVVYPVRIETINVEFETIEFFPYFLATMELRLGHDYSQGDNPFA